jgi:hypothetical protein
MAKPAQSEIPAYVSRQRAARELDMSPDAFDDYVHKGILPSPKRRGTLTRWKWSEIAEVLDGGNLSLVQPHRDPYDWGVERAKATNA